MHSVFGLYLVFLKLTEYQSASGARRVTQNCATSADEMHDIFSWIVLFEPFRPTIRRAHSHYLCERRFAFISLPIPINIAL